MSRFGSWMNGLGYVCAIVLVLSSSVVASGTLPPDSSFTVADFMNMFYYEYAVDSIGGEPWVYVSVRPPHTEDESALEEIGEFVSRRDDGPGLYRIRVRDLPRLYSLSDVKFTYCKGGRMRGFRDEGGQKEFGSIELTLDLPIGGSLPGYRLLFYREKDASTAIDSSDQVWQRFWQAHDLRNGVIEGGLPAGNYACYLVAPLVDPDKDARSAKVANLCTDVFVSGIAVEAGYTTQVHLPYSRFDSSAERILRTFGAELAIKHTDSGAYIDIIFKMAEGSTFGQLDSAGVHYNVWGEGLYWAEVPVAKAFEIVNLSSVWWVHFCEQMYSYDELGRASDGTDTVRPPRPSVLAEGGKSSDSLSPAEKLARLWYSESAVDSLGSEDWVTMWIRPPHDYDKSTLEMIGFFMGPVLNYGPDKEGPRTFVTRARDLSLLWRKQGVEYSGVEKVYRGSEIH